MLQPGHVLQGRYRIVRRIGGGGMGTVYLAEDIRLPGRRCAVKETSPSRLPPNDQQWAVDAFRQEAQMLATISHPGLTAVTDFFSETDNLYLVMDYVDGQTLEEILMSKPEGGLPQGQVLNIARQLCDVLEYLHSRTPPVIFRDLKPPNVMLTSDGQVKLIDFGIARFFKPAQTQDTVTLGTPGYAAPEQWGSAGQSDARSDIYGLGVLLLRLSTGYDPVPNPFPLPKPREVLPTISTKLERLILCSTPMEPGARYQSIAEFRRDMDTPSEQLRPLDRTKLLPQEGQPVTQVGPRPAAPASGYPRTYQPAATPYPPQATPYPSQPAPSQPQPTPYPRPATAPKRGGGIGVGLGIGIGIAGVLLLGLCVAVAVIGAGPLSELFGGGAVTSPPVYPPPPTSTPGAPTTSPPTSGPDLPTPTLGDGGVVPTLEPTITPTAEDVAPSPLPPTSPPTSVALRVAYVRGGVGSTDIYVANAAGGGQTCVACGSYDEAEPAWSPDGLRIAYQAKSGASYDIWSVSGDGGSPTRLTNTSSTDEREPDWSSDGSQIVYRATTVDSDRNADGELWVMNADGSGQRRLGGKVILGRSPTWSPTGQKVLFMSQRTGRWQIYVYDLQSGSTTRLTNCSTNCRWPCWSPDGQDVAYHSTKTASGSGSSTADTIWIIPAGGGTAVQLVSGNNAGRPSWSSDGQIVFNSQRGIEAVGQNGSGRRVLISSDVNWAPDWSK